MGGEGSWRGNKSHSKFWAFDFLHFKENSKYPSDKNDKLIILHSYPETRMTRACHHPQLRPLKTHLKSQHSLTCLRGRLSLENTDAHPASGNEIQQHVLLWPSDTVGECFLWKDEYNSSQRWEQVTPASNPHLNSHLHIQLSVCARRWMTTFSHWVMPAVETLGKAGIYNTSFSVIKVLSSRAFHYEVSFQPAAWRYGMHQGEGTLKSGSMLDLKLLMDN